MYDKKIIFMGTPNIAVEHLKHLIEKNLNIVGVFTQPPRKKNRGLQIEERILIDTSKMLIFPVLKDIASMTMAKKIEAKKQMFINCQETGSVTHQSNQE